MSLATPTLPTRGLLELVEELRTVPDWPDVPMSAGLLVAETVRALDWPDAVTAAVLGLDAFAAVSETVEVLP